MCAASIGMMNVLLDTYGVIDVVFGSHPEAHRGDAAASTRSMRASQFVPEHGQADIAICGVFAPIDHRSSTPRAACPPISSSRTAAR